MTLSVLIVFSFLSFNTRAMMPDDARLGATAQLARGSGADFVFFTEEYTEQLADSLAADYPYSAVARSHIDETERFYSKYPVVDVKDICPLANGDCVDCWVHRVRVAVSPRDTVNLYCCHLPHGMEDRVNIVDAILKDAAQAGGKSVVGGDMNSLSISLPMQMLVAGGFVDCWAEKGHGDGSTYHGLPLIAFRIDYIFHSKDLTLRSVNRIPSGQMSDHDALYAEFSLED